VRALGVSRNLTVLPLLFLLAIHSLILINPSIKKEREIKKERKNKRDLQRCLSYAYQLTCFMLLSSFSS
jgi:hypothetical protein